MTKGFLGTIIESEDSQHPIGVFKHDCVVSVGSFVEVFRPQEELSSTSILAVVEKMWSSGGVATYDTARFHLERLEEVFERSSNTIRCARLLPVGTISADGKLVPQAGLEVPALSLLLVARSFSTQPMSR